MAPGARSPRQKSRDAPVRERASIMAFPRDYGLQDLSALRLGHQERAAVGARAKTCSRSPSAAQTSSCAINPLVGCDLGRLDDTGPAVDLAAHEVVRLGAAVAHRVEAELGKFRADRRRLDAIEKCAV